MENETDSFGGVASSPDEEKYNFAGPTQNESDVGLASEQVVDGPVAPETSPKKRSNFIQYAVAGALSVAGGFGYVMWNNLHHAEEPPPTLTAMVAPYASPVYQPAGPAPQVPSVGAPQTPPATVVRPLTQVPSQSPVVVGSNPAQGASIAQVSQPPKQDATAENPARGVYQVPGAGPIVAPADPVPVGVTAPQPQSEKQTPEDAPVSVSRKQMEMIVAQIDSQKKRIFSLQREIVRLRAALHPVKRHAKMESSPQVQVIGAGSGVAWIRDGGNVREIRPGDQVPGVGLVTTISADGTITGTSGAIR